MEYGRDEEGYASAMTSFVGTVIGMVKNEIDAAAQEEAEKLKQLVEQRITCGESLIAELSPALGVHSGPGTVGVCYFPVRE